MNQITEITLRDQTEAWRKRAKELEAENAALRADKARLTPLLCRCRPHLPSHDTYSEDLINDVEAAIDAARKDAP